MAIELNHEIKMLSLKQSLAVARQHLPGDERAKLDVGKLPEIPEGIDRHRVFVFDSLGGLSKVIEGDTEVFVSGPINRRRRDLIARSFGFNLDDYEKITVNTYQMHLGKKEYFVPKNRKEV